MKKITIKLLVILLGSCLVVILYLYGRNQWLIHDLQSKWYYSTVEVNDGELISLSKVERKLELTANGSYLIDQEKEYDYRFKQRSGKLYLQLYHKDSEDGPPFVFEYLVRKHRDYYTLTDNEVEIDGVPVATGIQLK